jgi:hydrogen peroxide-dependent heme synthase
METQNTLPAVPLTLEGSWVLHQMFRIDRQKWLSSDLPLLRAHLRELTAMLQHWAKDEQTPTALYSMMGHKADLMLVHFRPDAAALHRAELEFSRLEINRYLTQVSSYVSVVELGLYESSVKTFRTLAEQGLEPHSEEWTAAVNETMERQKEAMGPRLYPSIPDATYICFYPMDRRRGESKNWYMEPIEERQRMMHEHGLVGRRYAGQVKQIITGSVGLDDWEWGVDLFAEDPAVFKKLIYEMRFDEVSAVYAAFGTFYVGLRIVPERIQNVLIG